MALTFMDPSKNAGRGVGASSSSISAMIIGHKMRYKLELYDDHLIGGKGSPSQEWRHTPGCCCASHTLLVGGAMTTTTTPAAGNGMQTVNYLWVINPQSPKSNVA